MTTTTIAWLLRDYSSTSVTAFTTAQVLTKHCPFPIVLALQKLFDGYLYHVLLVL